MSAPRDTPTPVEIEPPDSVVLAISNAPDADTAQTIARALVTERLAACVNVLAPCVSIYRWQGEIEEASEVPMLIKTTRRRWVALEARLRELHPYEVPELIALSPAAVSPAYASWVLAQTRRSPR
ncbi:MAG: divalent-cation tolerance protein CutA [Betaproteobacteria bacterium]|nr:divalent-cation tolerance protein CutA [Betaproteobacteria bacterium]